MAADKVRQFDVGREFRTRRGIYRLIKFLGGGGSAETWKAEFLGATDPSERYVAIKLPRIPGDMPWEIAAPRLHKLAGEILGELPALRRLKDLAGVAHFVDYGDFDLAIDGNVATPTFFVQEYIDGIRLDEYVRKQHGDPFFGVSDADSFLKLARQIAERLLEIHRHGVVHGDVWHNNIMVREHNDSIEVVFVDFGDARFRTILVDEERSASNSFLAPEHKTSVRADLFSMGRTLFFLATGLDRVPDSEDIDTLKDQVVEQINLRNQKLYLGNFGVADLIARCIRRNDRDRPENAAAIVTEIEALQYGPIEVERHHQELGQTLVRFRGDANPLLTGLANHRAFKLLLELEEMLFGMCDLTGSHDDLVVGMVQLTSGLADGGQYFGLSLPSFWYRANMGSNGRFLAMNKLAASRGAAIKRVLVCSEADYGHPEFMKVLDGHVQAIAELESLGVETANKDANARCFIVGIKCVTAAQQQAFIDEGHKVGIICRDSDQLLVSAVHDRGQVTSIRLRSSPNLIVHHRNYFEKMLREADLLQDRFESIRSSLDEKRRPQSEFVERQTPIRSDLGIG